MKTSSLRHFGAAALLTTIATLSPLQAAEVVVTESVGTVSSFSPEYLVIRSETASAPTSYVVSKDIVYVDETGAPVSMEVVRSGAPVTVHYVREADRVVARRVVVRRTPAKRVVTTTAPVVEERVVRPAPTVIEKRTTTTTTTTTAPVRDDD